MASRPPPTGLVGIPSGIGPGVCIAPLAFGHAPGMEEPLRLRIFVLSALVAASLAFAPSAALSDPEPLRPSVAAWEAGDAAILNAARCATWHNAELRRVWYKAVLRLRIERAAERFRARLAADTPTLPTGHVAIEPGTAPAPQGPGWVYDPAVDAQCWGGPCYRWSAPCVIPAHICERESQGWVNIHTRLDSSASGKYQALISTWGGYGGYYEAGAAPESVQDEWAARLWDGGGGCSHWSGC